MSNKLSKSSKHASFNPASDLTEKEKEGQRLIIGEVDKSMKLLEDFLLKFCQENQANSVPMIYVSTAIKQLMNGYKESIK